MAVKMVVFVFVTFLHNLFTVIWMGGLIVTLIGFLPALKNVFGPGPQVKKTLSAFQKRQSLWVYISIFGLLLTGLLMSNRNPEFQHIFGFGSSYSAVLSIKHILVLLMIGVTLYRSLVLGGSKKAPSPKKEAWSFKLLFINLILALAVLFTSSLISALAAPLSN